MPSTSYITTDGFKNYASVSSSTTQDDVTIASVVQSVFNAVNQYCGRDFSSATGSRVFEATATSYCIAVDDISTATGVTISHDTGNTAVYSVTWAASDYELRPLNGRLNGSPWPYTEIRAVGTQGFPLTSVATDRAHVQVSATWGWPGGVPADVIQANYVLAMDVWKSKDAPFGVAGTTEFGNLRVSNQVAGMAKMLLQPYHRGGVML